MAALHGTIGDYDRSREEWTSYCERLEQYFMANDVTTAGKQRAVLLSVCGAHTYQLIRNLVAPGKPTDKTFGEIVKLVNDHHNPPPSVIVQRFTFNTRSQKEGETIAEFVAELRRLSEHCKFERTLDDMIRDRIVCGIRDARMQRRLLAEPELTFKKAFELAQASEAAERNSRDLQKSQATPVHALKEQTRRKTPQQQPCYRCGGRHSAAECRFKDAECHSCKKKGHLAKVCRSKPQQNKGHGRRDRAQHKEATHQLTLDDSEDPVYTMFHVPNKMDKPDPMVVTVKVNDVDLAMEVDTGASASIMSEKTYNHLWSSQRRPPLQPTHVRLRTYTGEELRVCGTIATTVQYCNQTRNLTILVVEGTGPTLMGRDWLVHIKLNWQSLHQLQAGNAGKLQHLLGKHAKVFSDELGLVKDAPARIQVDPGAQPKFCKPRPVPYALRSKIEQEIERLERAGIIEQIQFSNWAAPIVPVVKPDGSIRICGDYKVTVNRATEVDTYPLPKIEDLFASLARGKKFTKLDLAHAYLQIPLEEDSKQYVAINTHKGLYRYNRLPFGVSSAPSIFQRTMESILRGIPKVCIYLDDILVTGESEDEHLKTLDEVFTRLDAAGLRLKRVKCAFMMDSVEYLGHQISAHGLSPTKEKVKAITEAPAPQNVSQLRSFLGLVNYYGKFLPQLSSTLAPLYRLLRQHTKWAWDAEQSKAFQEAKQQLTSSSLLVHYDPTRELILSCDASPYGVGAVLSHRMEDGTDKPVAFASRSLAPAEKRYAQLDKEGLAIIFGVKKFRQYLLGRKFVIYSDHKPLQSLFSESRPVPAMASARIQRWALTLSAYDYVIQYRPGKDHANADVLSRLLLPIIPATAPKPGETVLLMETLQASPVTAAQIRSWTDRDPVLSHVRMLVQKGWQNTTKEPELKPFEQRKDELSIEDGCLLWGSRVVVPKAGRTKVMEELHIGHPGISRMKSLARGVVWWPKIDADLQEKVQECNACQVNRKAPASAPLHPWEWPGRPWSRLHIDHAGPFMGKTFLIVVDAHSKWLEVEIVSSTASQVTIKTLRSIFATHGLPDVLVSDNGTSFTSSEFQEFTRKNGIQHITSAPYHPATNGLAERAVQTFKEGMKKMTGDLETRLARFLFQYRITPHSTTASSPSELLMGRRPKSHLDLLVPNLTTRVQRRQNAQKAVHDQHTAARKFEVNDAVFIRSFKPGDTAWKPGVVVTVHGPLSYEVKRDDGRVVRCHIDHVRKRTSLPVDEPEDPVEDILPDTAPEPPPPVDLTLPSDPRRSTRPRNPPERLMSLASSLEGRSVVTQ